MEYSGHPWNGKQKVISSSALNLLICGCSHHHRSKAHQPHHQQNCSGSLKGFAIAMKGIHYLACLVTLTATLSSAQAMMNVTVRAIMCISNSTHCHCAMKNARENSACYKPVQGEKDRCYVGKCAAGYHCDCSSNNICELLSAVYYRVEQPSVTTDIFDCVQDQKKIPRAIVGQTADFHIMAYGEFQLFINSDEIGFGESHRYKVFTGELRSGDVIGVIVKRHSPDTFGIKFRFNDLEKETRFIDENWYASATFSSSWLDKSFDPIARGWVSPVLLKTINSDSFDPNVPWMWLGSEKMVFFRYAIP